MPVLQGEGIHTSEVLDQQLPDLMAEYSGQTISLYGVTGTPEELLRMCPVHHENMTAEAKNMFLVMAMNESEIPIKEEHMPYFREITQSRGVELKVTIQEAPSALSEPRSLDDMPGQNNKDASSESHSPTSAVSEDASRIGRFTTENHVAFPPDVVDGVSGQSKPDGSKEVCVDESTTVQMDTWLRQTQLEHEDRSHHLGTNILFERIETTPDEAVVVPLSQSGVIQTVRKLPAKEAPPLRLQEEDIGSSLLVEITYKPLEQDDTLLQSSMATGEPRPMDAAAEASEQPIPAEGLELLDVYDADDSTELEQMWTDEYERLLSNVTCENEQPLLDISGISASAEQQPKEILTFAELLPDGRRELSGMRPEHLIDQIASYIGQDNLIIESAVETSAVLIAEINALTNELVSLSREAEFQNTEIREKIEERLHDLCDELLEMIGARGSDELLKKFIFTIISEKVTAIKATETGGRTYDFLHERKMFTLHSLAFSLQAKLPSFQLLGRYALAI